MFRFRYFHCIHSPSAVIQNFFLHMMDSLLPSLSPHFSLISSSSFDGGGGGGGQAKLTCTQHISTLLLLLLKSESSRKKNKISIPWLGHSAFLATGRCELIKFADYWPTLAIVWNKQWTCHNLFSSVLFFCLKHTHTHTHTVVCHQNKTTNLPH